APTERQTGGTGRGPARAIFIAVARMRPATTADIPVKARRTGGSPPNSCHATPRPSTMAMGAAIIPPRADADPAIPPARYPNMTERLQIVGPGMTWLKARSLAKASGVSQRRRSTRARYANGSTPPKPESAIWENAMNSANGEIFGGTCPYDAGDGPTMRGATSR